MTASVRGWIILLALLAWPPGHAAEVPIPGISDPRLEMRLVASEPEIVTPVGLAIDRRGRLFVVESHTHFPATNYPGPKFDRVKLFEDTDRDGKPDRISVFADGLRFALNLAFGPDGALYVTHRNGAIRLDDKDGDGVSESRATILEMETPASYPHNGISGIAFSPDGWLYVGQGQNLGEKYTLRGADGAALAGHGEGGNVFRCRPDGSRLQRVATGFWNPFGLAFYGKRFLLAVDNDPDSRPPNRLLDVVMDGDYGFKYRLGRNGLHPFQSWNGELPGTLPMASAAGEAASHILACDATNFPREYREAILVTAAWDHRVEVHRPKPFGASLRAERETLVQGDESFRPVGIATAPDGSVYLTDWVDASYNVHGKGRLWQLTAKTGAKAKPGAALTIAANASRKKMERLSAAKFSDLRAALADNDPFIRSAAIAALAKPAFRYAIEDELENKSSEIRLGALLALRRAGVENGAAVVGKMLADPDESIRRMALVWAGESKFVWLTNRLSIALSSGPVSPTLLRTYGAALRILGPTAKLAAGEGQGSGQVTVFDLAERTAPEPAVREELSRLINSAAIGDEVLKTQAQFKLAGSNEIGQAHRARPVSDEEWRNELAGDGDAASGRRIFFNASVGCARCHRIEDQGGHIGPDLSAIARGADREKLMRSILHPSRDIAPEFVAHTIATKDGQEFTGLLVGQSANEGVTLLMADGRAVLIPPAQIEAQSQSKISLMPEGLADTLTPQDFRDLLAFLLSRR